jgi:hypothetical protein
MLKRIVILVAFSACLSASTQAGTSQNAIAGDAFQSSGHILALYGVAPPAPSDPNAYAATLYLDTLLANGPAHCRPVPGSPRMACIANGADVGRRGIWRDGF